MSIEEMVPAGRGRVLKSMRAPAGLQAPPEFLEKLPLATYACDRDGRILWFNGRAADLWGREPTLRDDSEKYCGSYRLYVGGRQVSRDETPMAAVLRTGIPIRGAKARVERPDGSCLWVIAHIEPVEDEQGNLVGAINCFHETSAADQPSDDAAGGLRGGEFLDGQDPRPAAAYEHAAIGIAEVDVDGKLLRMNSHLADLLGYARGELLGRSIFDANLVDHAEVDQLQFTRQVRGEIDRYTVEKRFNRRDGTKLWVHVTSSSIRDAQGNFLFAMRTQQNITGRKQAEELVGRRAREQAALYEFTESLLRAASLDEVYPRALDAIDRALACDRASVLLFDSAGVMKFVASRGLSEAYRKAVEGHSPWQVDTRNAEPVCIDDLESADLPDDLKNVARAEGIGALAFIPITTRERLVGKFMTYYDRPHEFTKEEIYLALTLARQIGLAIERAHAEEARQRVERAAQQLVAIVESSHDAIVSKDLDGIIITWNQGAERLFGYSAAEVIGKPITIIIPPDRLDEEPAILARIRSGDRVDHFETIRRRKDGSLVDISLTISPVRDNQGRVVGASKIARDITERKEAEAKLRDSERQLKDLLAAIPAAIYTTDAQGRITYYNQAAVELAGRIPTLGTDEWCVTWKLYWPDGTPLPHDQCPMAIALKEGRSIRNAEAIAERPDGTRIPFIPYPTPLRDSKGKIVGAINMLVDVSERKQAETQQRVLFNELNHRVKNNMQMLQSLLYMAGRQTRSTEAKKVLNEASNRIAAMAAAQQVLYATKDTTHFDTQEFLNAVCRTMQQTLPKDIEVICESTDARLSNDTAVPLAHIVNELVTNAVKHGTSGAGQSSIRVGLARHNDSFALWVEDDGPGFDLQSVRHRSSGLQLVQALARQLGGKFEVTRAPCTRCAVHFV